MILQALYEYYQRKAADPKSNIAPEGWEWKEIPFLIVIDKNGKFLRIEDTREGEGNKKRAKSFLVFKSVKRSSGINAYLLWDNAEYVLGINSETNSKIIKRHEDFVSKIKSLPEKDLLSVPLNCVINFLEDSPVVQIEKQEKESSLWAEIKKSNPFITFRVEGMKGETVFESLKNLSFKKKVDGIRQGVCLITGENDAIEILHPAIKGVRGCNTTGGSLVSFNAHAFTSFNKDQGDNAITGKTAAFAYSTALNELLGKDSDNKFYIGDTSAVFWGAQKNSEYLLENDFGSIFGQPPKDDPDRGIQAVKNLYQAISSGKLPQDEQSNFFVLGLAPNAARISVRFFKTGTVKAFADKVLQHFNDLDIVKGPQDREYFSLNQLLIATVFDYKSENIPPNLAGKVVESVLDGTPYPQTLLQLCMRRIRAEAAKTDQNGKSVRNVTHTRAAILKACLNRHRRFYKTKTQEVTVSLDKTNPDIGYRIGRLFAVLEKIQEEAQPGINATIRDRYYGAVSSNPVTVLPQLLKLKNHHLAKLHPGRKINMEKEIGEIMDGITVFPAHLALNDQAQFAIGYYHQRQDFFISKKIEE